VIVTTARVLWRALHVRAAVYHFHDPELIPVGLILRALGKHVIYDVHEDVPADILGKYYLARRIRSSLGCAFGNPDTRPAGLDMLTSSLPNSREATVFPPALQASNTFGFPGANPVISSAGATSGIVWALDTSNNGTPSLTGINGPAILYAYDATRLNKLFSSPTSGAGAAGNAVKFTVPAVVNGKVYVGTQSELSVFALPEPSSPLMLWSGMGLLAVLARRRFAETSIAQPVEIDWSIRIGGKKEGIHRRSNAVASLDIGRHALWPRDQLVAEAIEDRKLRSSGSYRRLVRSVRVLQPLRTLPVSAT